jgi:hypothetical protein
VRRPLICPKARPLTTEPRGDPRGVFVLERDGLARTAMKFTVTSRVGVNEVAARSESARAALEQVLVLLGRKRTTFASLMRTARAELRQSYACSQLERLQCCPIIRADLPGARRCRARRPYPALAGRALPRLRTAQPPTGGGKPARRSDSRLFFRHRWPPYSCTHLIGVRRTQGGDS